MAARDKLPVKLMRSAIEKWGFDHQLALLQEECAEVIHAISHYRRGLLCSKQHLLEELADLSIVHQQIIYEFAHNIDSNEFRIESYYIAFAYKAGRLERMIDAKATGCYDDEEEYDGYY